MSKAGYVLHGTGGVDGSMREGQVRRSQLKHASAQQRKQSHGGKSTLTLDARIAEKQLKEDATKHLRKQRMMDPSFWCAPGVDREGGGGDGGCEGGEEAKEVAVGEGEGEAVEGGEEESAEVGSTGSTGGAFAAATGSSGAAPMPRVVVSGEDLTRLLSQARGTTLGLGRKVLVSLAAQPPPEHSLEIQPQQQEEKAQQEVTTTN